MHNKIIVAVTGASGAVYAKILLDKLLQIKDQWQELGVVMSNNAKAIWQAELGNASYHQYDANFYDIHDFSAPFASGSAKFNIMLVVPCSMGTLGRIASGMSNDLITRAADVMLKERRKLIVAVRETPYSLIHLKNMEALTLAGGIVCPATPSFYSLPQTIEELAGTVIDRIIDLSGLKISGYEWGKKYFT
jgi:4-hydroxy-3-polyprenylbenzoate decarboxylase